ncbi:alpha/beta fold hydrolase [Halotalea alkalilenta]|uniref:alpha/beta fold hydrolase n=1 Tax=Halotalea alkalilenta TaxID=376489 RepID=UPI0004882D14|nr:alpha/beta fold hydrolase [Halotalea alkalilenta]
MEFFDRGGRLIGYRLLGPEAAPLVVLAHPLGMSQSVWDGVLPALLKRHRVLTWDLPGHGASAPCDGPLTLDALVEDLLALVALAGSERFDFVGTSIGGVIGQALLRDHRARLNQVVLTNTGARIGTPEHWAARAERVLEEGLSTLAPELAPRWFSPVSRERAGLVEGWTQGLARTDDRSYARLCAVLAGFEGPELDADAARGVHLLGGADDLSTPPQTLESLAAKLADAPLEILEHVGHVPSVEAPDVLAARLDAWLAPAREGLGMHGVDFDTGIEIRKRVLGTEHVERSLERATPLDAPFQQLITRFAWGELWGDPTLSVTQRSHITLAILAALGRDGELALHLRTARRTGVSEAELRQVMMHVATYAGVPAANHALAMARQHGWGDRPTALE